MAMIETCHAGTPLVCVTMLIVNVIVATHVTSLRAEAHRHVSLFTMAAKSQTLSRDRMDRTMEQSEYQCLFIDSIRRPE